MSLLNLRRFKKSEQKPDARSVRASVPVVAAPKKILVKESASPKNVVQKTAGGILTPRVSEKATMLRTLHCYVFNIPRMANKRAVAQAVFAEYKKKPVAVRIVNFPKKSIVARGKRGTTGGGKKAYVFLKKGETIEI